MAQQQQRPVRRLSGTDPNMNPGINAGRGMTLAQRLAQNETAGIGWVPGMRAAPAAPAALPASPAPHEPPQGGRGGKKTRKLRKLRKTRKGKKRGTRRL